MSNAVFPSLPGITWNVLKSPRWSTKVQQSASGKEMRASYFSSPIFTWQLTYELLRASALLELQTLLGFFNARQGRFDSFLFSDPADNNVTAHGFGVGDGAKVAFQLQRSPAGPRTLDFQGVQNFYSTPRSNLLIKSEQFDDAAWSKDGGISVLADVAIAPDGSKTMDRLTRVTGTLLNFAQLSQVQTRTPVQAAHTFSVWVQAEAGTVAGTVAVSDQSFATYTQAFVATTTPQRVSVTSPATWDGRGTAIGGGVNLNANGTLLVWGAHLEVASAPTPYIKTTTAAVVVNPAYWPTSGDAFEPVYDPANGVVTIFRNDWQGNQQLYPTARTNLLIRTEEFDNAAWGKDGGITVAANVGVAPDGTSTMDRLTRAAGSLTQYANLFQNVTRAAQQVAYTASIWVRTESGTIDVSLLVSDASFNTFSQTVTIGTTPQRITFTTGSVWNPAGSTIGLGVSLATLGSVLVWGAQLEVSPVATSYLKGVAVQTTQTDYALVSGLATLAVAPLLNAALTWTGSYYWRVRFDMDQADFNNFLSQLWEAKKITLVSAK